MEPSSASLALEQARRAAQDVRELASTCKVQLLRDEGCSIAQKAEEVISQIEEKAAAGSGGHYAHDAVECASKRVQQALSRVQGQLFMASHKYKGGFLSKVKATLDTSHKKTFKEAPEELVAALRALDSSLDVGQQDQNAAGSQALCSVGSQALTNQDSQAISESGAQLHPGIAPLQMPHMGSLSMGHGVGCYQGEGGAAVGGEEHGGLTETSSVKTFDAISGALLICPAELMLRELIGIGASKVYRGKWCNIDIAAKEYLAVDEDESTLALLQFNADQMSPEAARNRAKNALLNEVGLLVKLTHPNLVRFFGVCLDPPLVVMEYYRNGSVFKMLQEAQAAVQQGRANKHVDYLSWKRRLDMLYDVASGMMYLHSRCHVHGNLRSSNLFVTENGRVKIGDFGFTKRLKCSEETIKVARLTHPRWLAPELLNAYELSTASDVYSFGIIMYEVLTYKIPFEGFSKGLVAIHVLANKMRPQIPSFDQLPPNTSRVCLANYIRLMEACWDQDPTKRPSFHTVARRLKAMQRWYWACNKALELSSTTTVRYDSAADMPGKAKGWLKGSRDSSELLQAVQQPLLEQQQLADPAPAPHTDAGRQQEQQGQDAAAAAVAKAVAMQAQQQPEVFGAEDSPFFALLESCVSTGSVELGPFAHLMSRAAANQSAAVEDQAPRDFGSLMPAFMDPYALDDSSLPATAFLEAPATQGNFGTGVALTTALGKLELVFLLGEYADHQVYYGLWAGRKVTAKVYAPRLLRDDPFLQDMAKKGLIKEVQESLDQDVSLLTRLQHPNIVPFLGACDDPPTLLLEFYQHGSISWVVHKAARQLQLQRQGHIQPDKAEHVKFLDWGRRLQLLSEVASALAYMHAQGVVHGDLCSSGIFIGGDGRAKVGELLMPSSLAAAKNGYDVVLTHLQYTAPELLGTYPDLSPTTASDVYSFGVLMFELLSWVAPYEGRRTAEVEAAVMAGLRPELPSPAQLPPDTEDHPCYPAYLGLMEACWDHDPKLRPTFADIHRALQELHEPLQQVALPATGCAAGAPTQAVSSTALVPPAEHTSALLQGGLATTLGGFGSGEESPTLSCLSQRESPFLTMNDTVPDILAAAAHTDSPKALQECVSHAQQADVQVIHAADLEAIRTIGRGAEGTVYQCRWFGVDVAAKALLLEVGSDGPIDASEPLMQTAALLSQLRHPNLARFLGICWSPPMLVSEYYPLGSLFGTMWRLQQKMAECNELPPSTEDMSPLGWRQRLEILQDVATAAAYMHSRSVVHGDIRSLNIFLTDSGQAKLGDFGFARTIDASNKVIGTCKVTHPRWAAPELMEHKQMGTASDVYSFGMVMYELMSWEVPFADLTKDEVVPAAVAGKRPVSTKGSQLSQDCPEYITLMEQCWAQQPSQRPTMQQVVDKLAALLAACSTKGAPGQELPVTQSADQAGLQEQQQDLQQDQRQQQQELAHVQEGQELHAQQPDTCPAGSSRGSQPLAAPGKQLPPGGVPGTSCQLAAACDDDAVEAPHRKVTAAFLSAAPPRRLLLSARDSLHADERGLFGSKWPSCGISRGVSSGLYSSHIQELLQDFRPFHDDPLGDLQSSEFIRVPSMQLSETSQELHDDSAAGVAADAQGGNQQQQQQLLAADLSSMAKQLEPLQEVLPSTFQKLLLLSVLYAARKAASSLEFCEAQRASSSAATTTTSSSSCHKAGVVSCYRGPADATRGDVPLTSGSGGATPGAVQQCCQASCHQSSQLYDMLQWQQQRSAWHLLWACLQPLWSCSLVHWLLLQQMPAGSATALGSSMYTQLLYAAAAVVLALASCLLLLLWAAAAWLPHQQKAAAAAMAVGAGVCGSAWLLGWCGQGIGRRQRCFHTWLSLTEVPGDLLVAPSRDPTASTLCYSAWACRWPAGCGMQPSQGHLLSQQLLLEPELLLCSLPDCCYQLRQSPWQQQQQQQWPSAAASSSDVSPLPDQGSVQQQQQHQGKQVLTSGGCLQQAAPELVGLQDHPTLSGFLSEEVRRPQVVRALLLPMYNTLQQQQQQQQQWWRGWYQGSQKQLLVPIKWVCLNPPMVLQAVPPGSTLSAWINQHKLHSQQPLADSLAGASAIKRGDSADSSSSSSSSSSQQWAPPFPAEEWPAVIGWLQEMVLALQQLHKQGFIHGAVHAGCVHLQHDGGCSLSLAGPWFRDITLLRAVDPALAAPEQVKGHTSSGSSSSSPAVDVYGVGMLMWQLASGWVQQQQQQGDGLAEILAEVNWCHGMIRSYGAAFPGAPEAVAAGVAGWGSSSSSKDSASSHTGQAGSAPEVATQCQDRRHGWLPTAADSTGWLPSGYRTLMASCCCPQPGLRPSLKDLQKQLAGMVGQ